MPVKEYLFILTTSPFANSSLQENLEFALALNNFDLKLDLVLMNEALYLCQAQGLSFGKNLNKLFSSLPEFGISNIYLYGEQLQSDLYPSLNQDELRLLLSKKICFYLD